MVNTGQLVQVTGGISEVHPRNATYTVPAGILHRSEVAPRALHATLFVFDSSRGFASNAPVVGPINGKSYTQQRDPACVTASELAVVVEAFRTWESLYGQGLEHAQKAEWEEALRAYRNALHLHESTPGLSHTPHYKHVVLWKLGHTYRLMGRYRLASETLERALRDMPFNEDRVKSTGELGVVYRHMDRLEDAKLAFKDEYETAKQLNLDRGMCRAVGNLGMVNYQLFSVTRDRTLLDLATTQLIERVERARQLQRSPASESKNSFHKAKSADALLWEAIAFARLSLCYTEQGEVNKAINAASQALRITEAQGESTKTAFSRFFYGRTLLQGGRLEEARAQFNPPDACTPIIAMCKEPSEEHRQYIQQMIEAGGDLELRDEQGYSALDCAVYSGDVETQRVIETGLRREFTHNPEEKLEQHRQEAFLRKGYRELFQDKLRPLLMDTGGTSKLEQLRQVYAESLAVESEKRRMFDGLKFVRYPEFLRCGRIPRSSNGITCKLHTGSDDTKIGDFILFFSYRWVANDPGSQSAGDSPDDIHNTQHRRMVRAVNQFLKLHPDVDPEKLCIWIVSSSINPFLNVQCLILSRSRISLAWTKTHNNRALRLYHSISGNAMP